MNQLPKEGNGKEIVITMIKRKGNKLEETGDGKYEGKLKSFGGTL